ncbi:K02A2.6-like [Cordylochernes scorpioides]|uniref:K02A2.6-like n=1 Tax=Cordylochernes scorpioides TaxID=51811 RepID=A0ABY6KZQ0_9ARAC|nr:K02A2.6-like [Cordylochernes scorpioides]
MGAVICIFRDWFQDSTAVSETRFLSEMTMSLKTIRRQSRSSRCKKKDTKVLRKCSKTSMEFLAEAPVRSMSVLEYWTYPLPTQQDLFSFLAREKYFSKLYISNVYLQLEVHPSIQPLLTININRGRFIFKRIPFGLTNCPFFQSVMDRELLGIDLVICYIDDVLLSTASVEEHTALLKIIFVWLQNHTFYRYEGYKKSKALQRSQVEIFSGTGELLFWEVYFEFTVTLGAASQAIVGAVEYHLPLSLATDASQIVVKTVLSHVIESQEKSIMFDSGTERIYSQIEMKSLTIN